MHLQQQRIRSPDEFQLTDVNTVKHDSKHQRPSFRFIHIASEQPIHIVGIRKIGLRQANGLACPLLDNLEMGRHGLRKNASWRMRGLLLQRR